MCFVVGASRLRRVWESAALRRWVTLAPDVTGNMGNITVNNIASVVRSFIQRVRDSFALPEFGFATA